MIIQGDCLEQLKKLEDQSVDLIVTSPPYNMRTRIRNGQYTIREKSEHFSKKYSNFSDDLSIEDYQRFHTDCLNEMLRVSKIVCWNFQIVTGSKEAIFKIIGEFAEKIKDIIIWDKSWGQPAMHEKVLNSSYELILILENDNKKGRVIQNSKFKRGILSNIFRINKKGERFKGHGATFPVELPEKLIKNFSSNGDTILDPFMGSGTTGIACQNTGRDFIGIELDPEYFKIAEARMDLINKH